MSADGFVTRSDCQGFAGCDYTWRDLAGAAGMRRDGMTGVTSTIVSPDGERALLVAASEIEMCLDGGNSFPIAHGSLELVDLATGAVSLDLDLRTNFWSALAFTPDSDWFFAAPIPDAADCQPSITSLRAASDPFASPPGLGDDTELIQIVDDQRWLAFRRFDLGLVDPLTSDSFVDVGEEPSQIEATRGWVHASFGFGFLAQDVVSVPPVGPMRHTTLRDEDWFPFGSQGRWFRVCQRIQPDLERPCRVVDGQGEHASVDFRVTVAPDHPEDAVLLDDGAVVFVGPTDDGSRGVQRIDFTTGEREMLHPGDGTLRRLGDGGAALLVQDGTVWLIESAREEQIADHVTAVITMPQLPPLTWRLPGRQDDLALVVQSPDGAHSTLAILDTRTRRLATVTDRLAFTPPAGASGPLDDRCDQPWTTRHAGQAVEGLFQDPQALFFVEEGDPATLWLLPIDLSAPPRLLSDLSVAPSACHAPLVSPDATTTAFAEELDPTTTQITVSSTRP